MRNRTLAFGLLAAACVAAAIVSAAIAVVGAKQDREQSERAVTAARPVAERILEGGKPFVVVRTLDRKHPANYGRLAVAPLDGEAPASPVLAGPVCERTTFRAGTGMCLGRGGATTFPVIALDSSMKTTHKLDLAGVPSRVRISPHGHWGGVTAFLTGHSYAQPGQFSTAATIIDLHTGKVEGGLEKDFTVTSDGKTMDERDRNYWGLTFAGDEDTFYATVASAGKTWLIKGSIKAKRAHTVHANVECPALSPDGTRIGYKKAVGHDPTVWRFHVLDLKSGKETPLAETRPLDDQVEWLDDAHLLYREGETTWVVDADGSGQARLWMPASDSPAVVR